VLNRRFGRSTTIFAAAGARHSWKRFPVARYTTEWDELLRRV
jgi:hypothetical protein